MNIESLLQESEGTSLDFKSQQYRFLNASDSDKSELLKDVLAFANAFRRADAVILLGVQEVKGSAAQVVGITEHIDDAALQQFVNSKTNVPVQFSYQQHTLHGKSLGAIIIPCQQRPVYATRDYGGVRAGVVYYRLGSSTAAATPEVIARMGKTDAEISRGADAPILKLLLVNLSTRKVVVEPMSFDVSARPPLELDVFEDYREDDSGPFNLRAPAMFSVNRNYWRELATYFRTIGIARPVGFAIENISGVNAEQVRLSFEVAQSSCLEVYRELPDKPDTRSNPVYAIRSIHEKNSVAVRYLGDRWSVDIEFGSIQPKATAWAEYPIYFGANRAGMYPIPMTIRADNLPEPSDTSCDLGFRVRSLEPFTQESLKTAWYEMVSREYESR